MFIVTLHFTKDLQHLKGKDSEMHNIDFLGQCTYTHRGWFSRVGHDTSTRLMQMDAQRHMLSTLWQKCYRKICIQVMKVGSYPHMLQHTCLSVSSRQRQTNGTSIVVAQYTWRQHWACETCASTMVNFVVILSCDSQILLLCHQTTATAAPP